MQIHKGRSLQETTATRKHALKITYSRNTDAPPAFVVQYVNTLHVNIPG